MVETQHQLHAVPHLEFFEGGPQVGLHPLPCLRIGRLGARLAGNRSAGRFGVAQLLAVRQPDSQAGPKDTEEFAAVEDYRALLQGLAGVRWS